jgi:hypothetical protein
MFRKFRKLSPLLLILCGSCTQPTVDKPIQHKVLITKPNLAIVRRSQTVEIRNDWHGYSDITPVLRHYKLRLEHQQLAGNAYIAVGGYGIAGIRQQRTNKVKIPAAVVTKFLTTLSKTPLEVGAYQPLINRPDNYPAIEIKVRSDRQQVIFSSRSQRVDRIPWKITVIENKITKEYISNSTIPNQAFHILNSSLDQSGVDGIIYRRTNQKK